MERLFTIKQAARQLQVSEKFLRKLQKTGRLRIVHLGRAVRVSERELDRLCSEAVQQSR